MPFIPEYCRNSVPGRSWWIFWIIFPAAAVLVSSKDLQVGTKNLELMQKSKKVRFLSSNIVQADKPVFTPWFTVIWPETESPF